MGAGENTLAGARIQRLGLAALFVATSPFLLHYSQDATNYSWTTLWVALSALLLINAWRKDRGWLWAAWALSLAVASYSYYYTIFPIMLEAGAAICVGLWGMGRKHEGAVLRLIHAALAVVVALILYSPWAVVLMLNRDAIQTPLFPSTGTAIPLSGFLNYWWVSRMAFSGSHHGVCTWAGRYFS